MDRSTLTVSRLRPIPSIEHPGIRSACLVVGGAGLVGLLAQVVIKLPFTPVPITGQTLGVLVVGSAFGWRRGGGALLLYALAGVVGVPWFAGHSAGYASASFGFVLGFTIAAMVTGRIGETRRGHGLVATVAAMVAGETALYVCGVTWLAVDLHVGIARAIALGFTPFVIGDLLKLAIAASLVLGTDSILRHR